MSAAKKLKDMSHKGREVLNRIKCEHCQCFPEYSCCYCGVGTEKHIARRTAWGWRTATKGNVCMRHLRHS